MKIRLKASSMIVLLASIFYGCNQGGDSIVFENVTIIDAEKGQIDNQTVIVEGKLITYVGPADDADIGSGAKVVDGEGKYLIPGLWDAHVHVTYDSLLEDTMFPLFIANGVTSIRDTGGLLDKIMPWKEKSKIDDGNVPRLMVAGPLLDGHPVVYNGRKGRPKIGIEAKTPEEAVTLVEQFAAAGVDQIKSYEMLSPESFEAVIEKAEELGLMVTGHVPLSMDVVDASNKGLRSMEHLRNLEMATSTHYDSLLQTRRQHLKEGVDRLMSGGDLRTKIHFDQRYYSVINQDSVRTDLVLSALRDNNTWQTPTMTIIASWKNRVFDRAGWRSTFNYLPDTVRISWTRGAIDMSGGKSPEENIEFADWANDMIKKVHDYDIGIMAGTDTPIFFLTPGFSLHEELRLLVNAGLDPIDALTSATLRPAEYFSLQDSLGTIEPGKYADLVLLNANPLEDINNTQRIEAVMKSGKLHDREALNGILDKLENDF